MAYYYDSRAKKLHVDRLQLGSVTVDSDSFNDIHSQLAAVQSFVDNFETGGQTSATVDSDLGIYKKTANIEANDPFIFDTITGPGKFTVQATELLGGVTRRHIMEILVTADDDSAFCVTYADIATHVDLLEVTVEKVSAGIRVIMQPYSPSYMTYTMSGMIL